MWIIYTKSTGIQNGLKVIPDEDLDSCYFGYFGVVNWPNRKSKTT